MTLILARGPRLWPLPALLVMMLAALSLAIGGRPADAQVAPTDPSVYDWVIGHYYPETEVWPDWTLYNLRSTSAPSPDYLVYQSRSFGINLGWDTRPEPDANIMFQREGGDGALKYGDRLAIHFIGHGYIRYGVRTFGINLEWSKSPAYEWYIFGEGKQRGEIVHAEDKIALKNWDSRAGFLVYGERSVGVNLVWKSGTAPTPTPTPTPAPSTAAASLGFRDGVLDGTQYCTGHISFRLTPVSLTGSSGTSTPVVADVADQTVYPTIDNYCFWTTFETGLRVGTWQVDVYTGTTLAARCQMTFAAGWTMALFTDGKPGCASNAYP